MRLFDALNIGGKLLDAIARLQAARETPVGEGLSLPIITTKVGRQTWEIESFARRKR